MPDVKFQLGLDNRVKPGEQTLAELLASVPGSNAAEKVTDPITGKLIRVHVNLPDTASAQATAAINANPGVATATDPLPPTLVTTNLNATTGLVLSTLVLEGPGFLHRITLSATTEANPFGPALGTLLGGASGNEYTDGSINTQPSLLNVSTLAFEKFASATTNLVMPPGDLTINDAAGATVTANAAAITVDFEGNLIFYIDAAGLMYLARKATAVGGVVIGPRTYAEAVASGSV